MRVPVFTGVCPALVTPFHESGGINFDAFARLIDFQISAGVDAVCVCGTTGEASTLSREERNSVIRFCVQRVAGRAKVIAGTGSNSTTVAIELSQRACDMGADALLLVTPYYNKASQAGLVLHYEEIANNVNLPMILYHVPGRTGVTFTAETYRRLSAVPLINGVKEASGSLSLATQIRTRCPEDFYIWSGNDEQTVPLMVMGAKGVISVASNIVPDIMVRMTHLCLTGAYDEAAALQLEYASLFDALFADVNPIQIKTAMNLLGMDAGPLRLPLCAPSPPNAALLRHTMEALELL